MSILKKVLVVLLIGIGGFLALFLAFVATRPDNYRVERSQKHRRARRGGVRAPGQLQVVGRLVALGEARSRDQEDLRGAGRAASAPAMPGRATRRSGRGA